MTRVLLSSPSIVTEPEEGEAVPSSAYPVEFGGAVRGQINWRRGFFRLWIVGSTLYLMAVAAIFFGEIRTQFENFNRADWVGFKVRLVPMLCSEARGAMGQDFTLRTGAGDTCWYELPIFRSRYPEYSSLTDAELEAKLYAAVDKPLPPVSPTYSWTTLLNAAGTVFAIPLGVLLVGMVVGWAFSGFRRSAPETICDHYRS